MGKRYRDFKRVTMTASTGQYIVKLLVDKPFEVHYDRCENQGWCVHDQDPSSLDIARMIEPAITVGTRRAHIDLPDEPKLVKGFADRLRSFTRYQDKKMKNVKRAFNRIADEAEAWATRGPLHKLAEAGLELD